MNGSPATATRNRSGARANSIPLDPRDVAQPSHPEAGATLVDLLMGTAVATIGLLGVLNISAHVQKLRRIDHELGYAHAACRNTFEELRSLPLASLPALDGSNFDVVGPHGEPGFLRAEPGDPDGLPGKITVAIAEQTAAATLYRVRAEVIWVGGAGRQVTALEGWMGMRP